MSNNKPQTMESNPQSNDLYNTRANYFGVFNAPNAELGTSTADTTHYDAHIKACEAFRVDLDAAMDVANQIRANMFGGNIPSLPHIPEQKDETDESEDPDVVGLPMAA